MKYSMKDIKDSYPKYKAAKEPIWGRVFVRRFSYLLTYPFINSGWTADDVSLLSILIAVIGTGFMCVNSTVFILIGIIMLNLWAVMDCVDGNIARCKKQSSLAGEFFDALSGYVVSGICMIGFAVAAYNTTNIFYGDLQVYLIILGCLGGVCDILSRLVYQKYSNNLIRMEVERIGVDGVKTENEAFYSNGNNTFIKKMSLFVDYEFGIGGDELFFLIIAFIFNIIDIFTVLYSLYHILGAIVVIYMYVKKMKKYEADNSDIAIKTRE